MRCAISTEGDFVSAHFGRCPSFTLVDVNNGAVEKTEVIPNPGHQPGAIPKFLHDKGVQCIVAGGMGPRAQTFFDEFGIKTVMGVLGRVDEVARKLAEGSLNGGESMCSPGAGRGYGIEKEECDHEE